ncbi:Carnosine synthase 1 [Perkinsus olseni]|uniref:Carnosine synthase 1 n=1 Tax=Perkinsus olseni TaxID=32597 RepID=A0A7J6PMU1_PEROL|nr:Carnosine synthase 1 [Perkinsus olseni]
MLKQIPRELLEQHSEEGQALRQQLLRGATIAVICSGPKDKKSIYQRAAELGVKVVVIDFTHSWAEEMVAEEIIAKFIPIDFTADNEVLFRQALDAIRSLEEDPLVGPVDGICTFVEFAVPMAARLCKALGLPGPSVECVDIARDKHKTRDIMTAKGLPSIRNFLITDPNQLEQAAQHVGFPAVLKPIAGVSSLGVQKVSDMDDLTRTYGDLVQLLAGLRVKAGGLERVTKGKFTSRGPRLIEVNARMGAGPIRTVHRHVSGVDLAIEQLLMTVGIPSRPSIKSTGMSVGFASIGAPRSGVVDSIRVLG